MGSRRARTRDGDRMRIEKLDGMTKGWFVGDFSPTVLRTPHAEVGIKRYRAGDIEAAHLHKVAVELTAVVSGEVAFNGTIARGGDIVVVEPGETIAFRAISDAVTVVVKMPSVAGDKYLAG